MCLHCQKTLVQTLEVLRLLLHALCRMHQAALQKIKLLHHALELARPCARQPLRGVVQTPQQLLPLGAISCAAAVGVAAR